MQCILNVCVICNSKCFKDYWHLHEARYSGRILYLQGFAFNDVMEYGINK
jgi:hypothetical protein